MPFVWQRRLKALLLFSAELAFVALVVAFFRVLTEKGAVSLAVSLPLLSAAVFVLHTGLVQRIMINRYDMLFGTFSVLPIGVAVMALADAARAPGEASSVVFIVAAGASIVAAGLVSAFVFPRRTHRQG